ncbi:MAG: hypothetical protein CL840_18670 [Crocinitomicaceae bacterium]|nr:hypothetical protein [Crocinitomicaceae bacterium]
MKNLNYNWIKVIILILVFTTYRFNGQAQEVLINDTGGTPHASSMLEVSSTSKGMLVPRMTTTQMNAISSPATGLLIFNTTTGGFYFYNGTVWVDLSEDNLGDHKATQNIQLNSNYLSNDGDNEGIRIDNSGNIGIGTTTPTSALHISKDGGPQLLVSPASTTSNDGSVTIRGARNGSTSNFQAKLNFENYDNDLGGSNKLGRIAGVVTNASTNVGDLAFYSYSNGSTESESMRIDKDGEVGIGTNNPASPFHVSASPPTNANTGQIQIDESTTGNSMMLGRTQTYGYIQSQNLEPLALNPLSNNVGIGTTSPVRNLHIQGSGTTVYSQMTNSSSGSTNSDGFLFGQNGSNTFLWNYENGYMSFKTNNSERVRIDASGNVGIGTTSPNNLVHINGSSTTSWLQFTNTSTGTTSSDGLRIGITGTTSYIQGYEAGDLRLRTANTDRMTIKSDGKVGIGTTSPTWPLDVTGTSSTVAEFENTSGHAYTILNPSSGNNSYSIYREGGTNRAIVGTNGSDNSFRVYIGSVSGTPLITGSSAGNLGINTTSPSAKLHVNGTSALAGNTTITGNATVSSKTTTASFKVTGGSPGSNKVLVSDADGDATWQDVPSKTKSIMITPGMFPSESFSGATRATLGSFGLTTIYMTDGGNREIRVSVPIPVDWNGGNFTAKILYSASTNTGNIYFKVGRIYRSLNEDVSSNTSSTNHTLPVSSTVEGLQEASINVSGANSSDKFVHIYLRRIGTNGSDTNTGTMYIHGVNLEYSTN